MAGGSKTVHVCAVVVPTDGRMVSVSPSRGILCFILKRSLGYINIPNDSTILANALDVDFNLTNWNVKLRCIRIALETLFYFVVANLTEGADC